MSQVLWNDLVLNSPLLIVAGGALLLMMLEVFLPPKWPKAHFTAVVLLVALLALHFNFDAGLFRTDPANKFAFNGLMYVDPFVAFVTFIILIGSLLALLMGVRADEQEEKGGDYYCLYLLGIAGAIIFASAAELITMFLGLETMSMALYCLCGSNLASKRSAESGLKYFLLGSFSSAFMLYGISMIYGLTGTTMIAEIPGLLDGVSHTLLSLGMALIIFGFIFKIGGVPFHFWAPDVYEGAPTQVTAFMACVIKAASVAAAIRVIWVVFHSQILFWSGAICWIAALTMIVGNVVAIRQRSVKRMLAYSSIAHAGYMLVGVLAPGQMFGGGPAILFYLVGYTVMTIGAFAVVSIVESQHGSKADADDIVRFNGLSSRQPALAALMALFMLALAGLPPGMVGLLGKFYLFSAAVKADYVGLVIVGVMASAISCYYYLRIIVAMFFVEGEAAEQATDAKPIKLGAPMFGVLALCAAGTVLLGVFPSALYDRAAQVIASL